MTYDPDKTSEAKKRGAGRLADVPKISTYEAKQEALLMIRRGRFSPKTKLYHVVALLGTTGVLIQEHLLILCKISERSLRRYREQGLLDMVPTPRAIQERFGDKRIWTLGPIGQQLARLHLELVPTGYLESQIDNITHDVLCNLVYVKTYQTARRNGYTAILKSRYEASLKDFRETQILQPDAMIILRHETTGEEKHFVVEYHNEDFSSRAAEKIKKYEHVYREGYWQDQWHLDKFPPILIVTTHRAPALGYRKDITLRQKGVGVRCTYLIKPLRTFLDGSQSPLVWLDLDENKTVNLLKL